MPANRFVTDIRSIQTLHAGLRRIGDEGCVIDGRGGTKRTGNLLDGAVQRLGHRSTSFGKAIADRMPRMTITVTSCIKVKPRALWFMRFREACCSNGCLRLSAGIGPAFGQRSAALRLAVCRVDGPGPRHLGQPRTDESR